MKTETIKACLVAFAGSLMIVLVVLANWACDTGADSDYSAQIKSWGEEIDKIAWIVPAQKTTATFDSLVHTLGALGVGDKVQYYKVMLSLNQRDPAEVLKVNLYIDSLVQMFADPALQKRYPRDYSDVLRFRGDGLFNQKDYYNAYLDYFAGRSILDKMGDVCESAKYTSRIALIFFNEGKFYNAIDYWKKELKELKSCSAESSFELRFLEVQRSLNSIGIGFLSVNEPDSALVYFDRAMAFINQNEKYHEDEKKFIKYARIVVQKCQGEAYMAKGQTVEAERLFKKCLQHDEEIDWSWGVERDARMKLATLYTYSKDYKQAAEQLDILVADYWALGNDEVKRVKELQAINSLGVGEFAQAREALLGAWKSDHVNVRVKNREQKSDIGQFIDHFQHEANLKIADERIGRQRILIALFAVTAISLGIIAYLTLKAIRKKKQRLASLAKLNETVAYRNGLLQNTVDALGEEHRNNLNIMRVVAHDLRNPIGSMISASYLVFMDNQPTSDQAEVIEIIRTSGDKSIALIGDLLVSYSEEKMLVKTPLEIDDMVMSCIDMLRHKVDEKGQTICFAPSGVVVNADRKIWRVLCNLIGNSIKFSPVGGKICIGVEKLPEKVILSVQDNGIGIPDEIKADIFELNTSKGRAGTSGEKSFGLGLYSCREIIEAHQGNLRFDSVQNVGTTFFVELPLA